MKYSFSNPEWFDGVKKIELNTNDRIFLWGAGKVGTVVAHVLEKTGYHIEGFVDIDSTKVGTKVYGYNVYSPEEYYKMNEGAKTIVSCAFPSALSNLEERGIEAYSPHSLLLEVDFEEYKGELTPDFLARLVDNAIRNYAMYYKKGRLIERLLFVITEKCTLKCENCDAYIPYHCHPKQSSYEEVIENYNTIVDVCGYVDSVDLLGGEPLLHKDLSKIVEYLINDSRCGRVTIISNGTLLPDDRTIELLKNKKCIFRISNYGHYSRQMNNLLEVFKLNKIAYEITNYQYWDAVPKISETKETEKELNEKFATCTANSLYVKANMACYCTFLSGLYNVTEENDMFPGYKNNIVLLDEGEKSKENLKKYILNLHKRCAIDACRYCPGAHCIQFGNRVPVAEQVEEWLPINSLYKNGKSI